MCNYPILVKNPDYIDGISIFEFSYHQVPCGKCKQCLQARSNQWNIRLHYENKDALTSYFVTLTYAQAPRTYNGLYTCRKPDIQNYFKRLRKRESNNTGIKYYAVSEYGTQYHRPHYHAIIFNVNDKRNLELAWTIDQDIIGHVDIGDVTPASIAYVSSYIGKKIGIPQYDYDDRLPEFSLMSKGLGSNYLTYSGYWNKNNMASYTTLHGIKHPLPRYYRKKIFTKSELKLINYEQQIIRMETEYRSKEARVSSKDLSDHITEAYKRNQSSSAFIVDNIR